MLGIVFISSRVWMLFIWQALKVDYARNTHVIFWHPLIHTELKEKVLLLAVHNITITKSNTFWCPWYHLMEMEECGKEIFSNFENNNSYLNQNTIYLLWFVWNYYILGKTDAFSLIYYNRIRLMMWSFCIFTCILLC